MSDSGKEYKEGDLIYGLEDKPPLGDAIFAALQHLLAMFVAVITPPPYYSNCFKIKF